MCVCALNVFSHTDMDQGSLAISNVPKIAYTGDNWVGRMIIIIIKQYYVINYIPYFFAYRSIRK